MMMMNFDRSTDLKVLEGSLWFFKVLEGSRGFQRVLEGSRRF